MKKCLILTVLLVIASLFVAGSVHAGEIVVYNDATGVWPDPISLFSGDASKQNLDLSWRTTVAVISTTTVTGVVGLTVPADSYCTKFQVLEDIGWSKVGAERFGAGINVIDLSGYNKLTFDAAAYPAIGPTANTTAITFGMGAGSPESCEKSITLSSLGLNPAPIFEGWTPISIDFIPAIDYNLSAIHTLWSFSIPSAKVGQEIYTKSVKYIGGQSGVITVTLSTGVIGVSVEGAMNFQGLEAGGEAVFSGDTTAATPPYNAGNTNFTVTNTGNVNETYSLEVLNPAPWIAIQSGTVGVNQYRLSAVFVDVATEATFTAENEITHALRATTDIYENLKVCEATGRYSGGIEAQSGYDVPQSVSRKLWLKFRPPESSTVKTQKIIVGVIAGKQL